MTYQAQREFYAVVQARGMIVAADDMPSLQQVCSTHPHLTSLPLHGPRPGLPAANQAWIVFRTRADINYWIDTNIPEGPHSGQRQEWLEALQNADNKPGKVFSAL